MHPGGRVVSTCADHMAHKEPQTPGDPCLDFDGPNVQGIYPCVWEEWEVKYFISGTGNMDEN